MFLGRRVSVRMASAAASAAGCLALAACGGAASSGGAASATGAGPTSTADPLASLSAKQVGAKVVADAMGASGLTLNGSISGSGETRTIDLAVKPGHGCTGTIRIAGHGSVKLTKIGGTVYMKPDKKFWEAYGGARAALVIALVDGRYLKLPPGDKHMGSLAVICDISQMISTNGKQDPVAKGKVAALGGTRVLALDDTLEGTVLYVTDTSKPRLVEMTAPKGSSGKIVVSYGAPVTLTAPPASQVLDGPEFGL